MASVLCNQCKSGIHYHGEPSGIKYIFIKDIDWKLIVSTSFDPNYKEYSEPSGSPKLYQTDTIEIDFSKEIHSAWKCPHCDSIMFFDSYGNVTDKITVEVVKNRNRLSLNRSLFRKPEPGLYYQ